MTLRAPVSAPSQDLPSLVDRATRMILGVKTAAEVLLARQVAGLACIVVTFDSKVVNQPEGV